MRDDVTISIPELRGVLKFSAVTADTGSDVAGAGATIHHCVPAHPCCSDHHLSHSPAILANNTTPCGEFSNDSL